MAAFVFFVTFVVNYRSVSLPAQRHHQHVDT